MKKIVLVLVLMLMINNVAIAKEKLDISSIRYQAQLACITYSGWSTKYDTDCVQKMIKVMTQYNDKAEKKDVRELDCWSESSE